MALRKQEWLQAAAARGHLAAFGCHEPKLTPGLLTHGARDISFILAVDDLGVKHKHLKDFEHLRDWLNLRYNVKVGMCALCLIFSDA